VVAPVWVFAVFNLNVPPVTLTASVPLPLLMAVFVTLMLPGPANVSVCAPPPDVMPPLNVSAFAPVFAACETVSGSLTVTRLVKAELLSVLPPSV
jgi:hypothetical protein